MKTINALVAVLLLAAAASAQSNGYGDPNFNRQSDWRSGMPHVLKVVAGNVNYAFSGAAAEIPFTLVGGPAEVWLAVYSRNANPQYGGAKTGRGGVGGAMVRAAGMDTFIAVTAGQSFPEGANTIAWDGKDFTGRALPAGNYTFYLFAVDNVDNPTLVGPGALTGYWSSFAIDASQNPPVIWAPQYSGSSWAVKRATMGTDYLANPGAWQSLDVNWANDRYGTAFEFRDITFFLIDPSNPNVGYMGKTSWNDDVPPQGIFKVIYDPANQTLLPDESWGDQGLVQFDRRVVGGALKSAVNHPWVPDDGRVYVADMDREKPMTPSVYAVDRATGAIVGQVDLTDIYLSGEGDAQDTSGPYGIDVDERGVYTTGFWIQPDAFPGHFALNGDVVWLNQNGDGILDRYFGDEATARGLDPNKDQMVNTHVKTGKYHVAILSGFNLPTWGSVVGPDGHGLFSISLPKMPVGLGTDAMWISNDSAIDGLYIPASAGADLVQWPFDVAQAVIGPNAATAVTEVEGALPAEFALGSAYPNPFNPSTTIGFSLPARAANEPVTLAVFSPTGQRIRTLVASELGAGQYTATWDGTDASGKPVASGVYLYRLNVGQQYVASRQMTLLK